MPAAPAEPPQTGYRQRELPVCVFLTLAGPTPTNISRNSEPLTVMNGTLASPAVALARRVFPVPGGPVKMAPYTYNKHHQHKIQTRIRTEAPSRWLLRAKTSLTAEPQPHLLRLWSHPHPGVSWLDLDISCPQPNFSGPPLSDVDLGLTIGILAPTLFILFKPSPLGSWRPGPGTVWGSSGS